MTGKEKNLEWLQHRTEEYHKCKDGVGDVVEEMECDKKLGQRFSSVDHLEEMDIRDGTTPRPTYVNAGLRKE
jgi:hypothetical protein